MAILECPLGMPKISFTRFTMKRDGPAEGTLLVSRSIVSAMSPVWTRKAPPSPLLPPGGITFFYKQSCRSLEPVAQAQSACIAPFTDSRNPPQNALTSVMASTYVPRGTIHFNSFVRVACRRRQKKYESPQSTLVVADGTNAAGRSPIERCAMSAETRLMAKPA